MRRCWLAEEVLAGSDGAGWQRKCWLAEEVLVGGNETMLPSWVV
jgi:hypothetical protein